MAAAIGQQAPDFERKDQDGNLVRLSGFQGDKAVALVFYPFSFTGICQGELCQRPARRWRTGPIAFAPKLATASPRR